MYSMASRLLLPKAFFIMSIVSLLTLSQEQDLSLQARARDMKQQSALKESWTSCKTLLFFRF